MSVWLYRSPSPRNCPEWTGDCCLGPLHGSCFGDEFTCDEKNRTISRPEKEYEEPKPCWGCCEGGSSEAVVITGAVAVCLSPLILAAGLLFGAVSGMGLLLKKIGVGCSEKSRAYQAAVKAYLVYEKARDNPRRQEFLRDLNKFTSSIKTKEEMGEEALFEKIPKEIKHDFDHVIELTKEQIVKMQDQIREKHNKEMEELKRQKEMMIEKFGEELSELNEKVEKCRVIWQKAQEKYFTFIDNDEKKPLITEN